MKQVKLFLSVAAMAIGTLSITSCGSDTEVCPTGYEGKDCKDLSRDKFIGTWDGKDICTSDDYDIELKVTAATDEVKALVNNPGGFGGTITITGSITDASTLTFTNQNAGGGRTLNGKMTINGSNTSINFQYTVVDGDGDTDNCNGTYSKL